MMAMVLVVDDNDWSRQALSLALENKGHRTRQAADLAGVRHLLRSTGEDWWPQVTLVELVREQGNGFSVAAWLQSRGHGTVVLLSERGDAADLLWARSRGIMHTESRADGVDQLCTRINEILAGSRAVTVMPGGRRMTRGRCRE